MQHCILEQIFRQVNRMSSSVDVARVSGTKYFDTSVCERNHTRHYVGATAAEELQRQLSIGNRYLDETWDRRTPTTEEIVATLSLSRALYRTIVHVDVDW